MALRRGGRGLLRALQGRAQSSAAVPAEESAAQKLVGLTVNGKHVEVRPRRTTLLGPGGKRGPGSALLAAATPAARPALHALHELLTCLLAPVCPRSLHQVPEGSTILDATRALGIHVSR